MKSIGELLVIFLLSLYGNFAYSQATYVQGSNANQLATQLQSGGFTITNPVLTNGGNRQHGTFSNGISGAGLSIDEGIVLTTGRVNRTFNNQSSTQGDDSEQGGTTYDDSDLIAINPLSNFDVVVYEFDFTIAGTEPKIFALDYQFASEEFPDFVCSDKNDIFGFFVSGGDLSGTSNIASVGGYNVAVNYVNSGTVGASGDASINPCVLDNSASFVFNGDGSTNGSNHIMYNGFTTTLRAYTILRPGITYHMKMAIADTADDIFDSGIFIAPIQIFDLPPKSDIDFDGTDDYVNTSPFFGGNTGNTMMSWFKLDNSFSATGDICGQSNFKLFVDGSRRLKTYAKTGSATYSYTITINDNSPADGLIGYVRIRINGGAWLQFNIGGFPTDWIQPPFGASTGSYTFEANPGDNIEIQYRRNSATVADMNDTSFQLHSEDGTLVHNAGFNSLSGNTNNTYSATCAGCSAVATAQTPNGSAPVLQTNMWYHATPKFDGTTGTVTLYLNGDQVWQGSGLGSFLNQKDDTHDFAVGRNTAGTNRYFRGNIDEVKVYGLALNQNQIREQIYQEVENVGGLVTGSTIPKAIDGGSLSWSDLKLYYDMDLIYDITLIDNSAAVKNGFLNNITSVQSQTAPIPYIANTSGAWTTSGTWLNGSVWDITTLPNKDWSIVQITNNANITTTASHTHLGLLIDSGSELEIQNDQQLQNTSYLKLDGDIDLEGEAQLVQTANSDLDVTSSGKLERDQQGKSSVYNYNYWSSPVSTINTGANNTAFAVADVLYDGTTVSNPQVITFNTTGYNGAPTTPITIADYWMFMYRNQPDDYTNWEQVRSSGAMLPGEGYTQKGSGTGAASQNYVFIGKPNNGVIQHNVGADNLYLVGNPYPSAIDANQFILDNLTSINDAGDVIGAGTTTGALYYWEHWGGSNHILANYQGGYATYNLTGATLAVPDPDVSSTGSGSVLPERYIPVGQGFVVQGDNNGGTIEFNNGQRIFERESDGESVFISRTSENSSLNASTDDIKRIYFRFTTPEGPQRQLLLGAKTGLADGINYGYDAKLLDTQFTDCAFKEGDTPLVIQTVAEFYDTLMLPIEITVGAEGECKFEVEDLTDLPIGLTIYFYDMEIGEYIPLETGIQVSKVLSPGKYSDRFYIVFSETETLGVEDMVVDVDNLEVYYQANNNSIEIINNDIFSVSDISLYNVLGQEVLNNRGYDNINRVSLPVDVSSGAYIVKFKYNNIQEISKKVIIK